MRLQKEIELIRCGIVQPLNAVFNEDEARDNTGKWTSDGDTPPSGYARAYVANNEVFLWDSTLGQWKGGGGGKAYLGEVLRAPFAPLGEGKKAELQPIEKTIERVVRGEGVFKVTSDSDPRLKTYERAVTKALDKIPQNYRIVPVQSVVITSDKPPKSSTYGQYFPGEAVIKVFPMRSDNTFSSTAFFTSPVVHEYGHAVDYFLGSSKGVTRLSQSPEFLEAYQKDMAGMSPKVKESLRYIGEEPREFFAEAFMFAVRLTGAKLGSFTVSGLSDKAAQKYFGNAIAFIKNEVAKGGVDNRKAEQVQVKPSENKLEGNDPYRGIEDFGGSKDPKTYIDIKDKYSPAEKRAVENYKATSAGEQKSELLHSALAKGETNQDMVVFRGNDAIPSYSGVGQILKEPRFHEVSLDPNTAESYGEKVLMRISVPKGTPAIPSTITSYRRDEKGLLFGKGEYKITSKYQNPHHSGQIVLEVDKVT
jgi:hypothetical protein